MPVNIAQLREQLRNLNNDLTAQRAANRALAANADASQADITAALSRTEDLDARARLLQDEIAAAESEQGSNLQPGNVGGILTDRRAEMLRSNEYARAFAYAIQNGINRKNGRHDERVKILYDAMTEGGGDPVGSQGGFLVPEDVQNQIIEKVRQFDSLAQFFGQEIVTAPTGWRVTDVAPTTGLVDVDEMGQIDDDDDQPSFAKISYTTTKKALILPVSNELATDNVANLFAYLSGWFAKKLVITENTMLITAMRQLTATSIASDPLKGIKTALNKGLDPAISVLAHIITNQSGFDVLDQLVDEMGRPLLQPNPTDETAYRIKGRPVHMISDAMMANVTGTADIFIGDGMQYATLFRCGQFELASTDVGGAAWRTDSTELRGIARLGVSRFDTAAMVRRSVTV